MSKIRAAIFFMGCCVALSAYAERADRDRPMIFEADAVRYDDLRQISTWTGNVVISRGTILIRAARVEVRKDQDGYQVASALADPGKKVFFRQKREGVDEFFEAESELMEYNERGDWVQFTKQAVMRRYRGAVLSDETSGAVIFLDNKTEAFVVNNPPSVSVPGARVRGVLTPRPGEAAPSGSPVVVPPLRASSGVGSGK